MAKKKSKPVPRPVVNVLEMPDDLLRELVQLVTASQAVNVKLLEMAEALIRSSELTAEAANLQLKTIREARARQAALFKKMEEEQKKKAGAGDGDDHPDAQGY